MDVDKRYDNDPDCEITEFRIRGFRIGPWTWILTGITVAGFLLTLFFPDHVIAYLAVLPGNMTGLIQVWRFVTASWICTSLPGLVLTILSLIFLFRMLEERIGSNRVWKFYLISMIAGNLALWMIFPANIFVVFEDMVFYTVIGGLWHTHKDEKMAFFIGRKYAIRTRVLLGILLFFACINGWRCGGWLVTAFVLLLACIGYGTIRLMDHMAGRRIRNKAAASGNRGKSSYIELE